MTQVLEMIRPFIRGIEVELREDNAEEVLSRLGREARSGQWPLVVCLGDPVSSSAELIELARRQPHNSFPGLRMIELIERSVRHEATHAMQIEATRKYVA